MRLRARLVSSLLSLLLMGTVSTSLAQAQQLPKLPVDTAVRIGKLENGMTYFIRHNALPEGKAEFHIAQRVGSMQEEDSQSGLAHFLEHMAFNGTKNFPGKGIINYLETLGVKFGENINAYTAFDKTVYTLMNVPVNQKKGVIDSCLLILHDWSCAISLEEKEIDAERGVIQEEWRSGNSARSRIAESYLRQAFPNNRYGVRLPIGVIDIIRNFKYQELRDYYKKWYRPDLQAIVVVGDINVDDVERRIKAIFSKIPKPVNPAERTYVEVEDNDAPIVSIATDPEATDTSLEVMFKSDALSREMKESSFAVVDNYIKYVISHMLNRRFSVLTKKPNAPFMSAGAYFGNYVIALTEQALSFNISVKEGQYKRGLDALVAEIERARQHGFTQSEYKHARKEYISALKVSNAEKDKRKSGALATMYDDYFCDGGDLATPETWLQVGTQVAENLPLEVINQAFKQAITDKNNVIALSGPKKDGLTYPTHQELAAQLIEARKQPVEPYKEVVSDEKLMSKLPAKGKIVKEDKNGKFGSTVWTLSNGVEVIIKPTDFKADQIVITGVRPGGLHSFKMNPADMPQLKQLNAVAGLGGLANFDTNALDRVTSGRVAYVATSLDMTDDTVGGSCNQEDLETMMQLLYLNFTAKRKDLEAFQTYKENALTQIEAVKANPLSSIQDTIAIATYPTDLLRRSLKKEDVERLSYDKALAMYKQRFANARGFKFFIVGNVDLAKLRPLVEQYIASLPATAKVEKPTTHLLSKMRKGGYTNHYTKPLQTPMGLVINVLTTEQPYSQAEQLKGSILKNILDIVYVETIREQEGGTYGVQSSYSLSQYPEALGQLQIIFQTDPAKAKYLNSLVYRDLSDIAKNGVKKEHFDKVVSNFIESHKSRVKENGYWLGQLNSYYYRGHDYVTNYESTLKSITAEDIRQLVVKFLDSKNRTEIMLLPEEKK